MYRFHYKEMQQSIKFAYTDTDSFIYRIETENLYNDLALNLDAYDTSDYPPDLSLYSRTNAKVLGKFKDECASLAVQDFVGILFFSPAAKLNLQPREFQDVMFKHEDYLHTLKTSFLKFPTIRSYKHILKTIEINKPIRLR